MNKNLNIRTFNGKRPTQGENVFIDPMACVSGDVHLAEDVSIFPFASIRGDLMPIKIGARSNVQDNAVLHTTRASEYNPDGFPLTIGNDVTVGHAAVLHACVIGNRVLVGMHATVLDGAIIEDDVMVGAGSLVTPGKRLESGYLYVGSPAKRARELTEQELKFLKTSATNYVELKNSHLRSLENVSG